MSNIDQVLLVDDDQITNMMHEQLIRKSGRVGEVLVATDGQAALDLLDGLVAQGRPMPELIFLDVNMPRMGGFEFLEVYGTRDMAKSGQLIIVMLSTSLLPYDHERAAADPNVHSFANKPIDAEAFHAIVDQYIASIKAGG